MFSGTYQNSLDSKGRVVIPAKFRDELGEGFVITKGLDSCLFVFPASEWLIFRDKLKNAADKQRRQGVYALLLRQRDRV